MTEESRHSVKVPRLFKIACKIAKILKEEGGSVKELVYSSKHPNIKALYALVVETLQHEKQLNRILEHSKILQQETKLDPWLARVLITELLWGKKRLSGESKPVKTILSYQSSFITDVEGNDNARIQTKDSKKVLLPRYARINTLYMTVKQAVAYFRDEGWIMAQKGDSILFPTNDHFRCDTHVPEVLAFPPGTQLYKHPLYQDGSILLQDKASCLAAYLLSPHQGSVVLDMCAAPGMKTTHLAAIMRNEGTIYAVEKDPKRYKTLCNFVEHTGATCVKTLQEDSIQLKNERVPNVEYILVDPSCSGSGIVGRPNLGAWERQDHLEAHDARLRKLVGFQKRLLCHALTSFPAANRVLYSTCSVLPAENEEIILWALNEHEKRASFSVGKSSWRLVEDPLPDWPHRGCEEKYPGIGNHCIYARTEADLTNGFFLAIFERDNVSSAQHHKSSSGKPEASEVLGVAENADGESMKVKKRTDGKEQKGGKFLAGDKQEQLLNGNVENDEELESTNQELLQEKNVGGKIKNRRKALAAEESNGIEDSAHLKKKKKKKHSK